MPIIYPIVEGHGEVDAVPLLLRRMLAEIHADFELTVPPAHRLPRSQIVQFADKLRGAINLGISRATAAGGGGVLVLIDADDDCPRELGMKFLDFVDQYFGEIRQRLGFVVANREYEAWFICCAEQMRGHGEIRDNAMSHPDPEAPRDAKGYFEREVLLEGRAYSETVDQSKFSHQINFAVARDMCRSFRKLESELVRLRAVRVL